MSYQIIVCGGLAPDPLQTLEPVPGPALKNEAMLPAVLDPWASHALYEAGYLAKENPGSVVRLVSIARKAKLQQVMMTVAQKLPLELVAIDADANGFTDPLDAAAVLASTIQSMPDLDRSRLLIFGGWESATRGAGVTMSALAAHLDIPDVFLAVDEITPHNGGFRVKERVEGGRHLVSELACPPAVFGWATGSKSELPNHPQTGMANLRTMMPALQRARQIPAMSIPDYAQVALPKAERQTVVVKDLNPAQVAQQLAEWIRG